MQSLELDAPVPEDRDELADAFRQYLEAAAERRVVIVVDALDQLDAADGAHTLNWLPVNLPPGVRIVVSSLDHPALGALRGRGRQVRELLCGPLAPGDSGGIVERFLERYNKRLDEEQKGELLAKAGADSPLYLLSALEQLRTLGSYEQITARIRSLPQTVQELLDWILTRLAAGVEGQEAFGEDLVAAYTSYIAIGRGGMTEAELAVLCSEVDTEGEFWVLHRTLRPYLMQRGELVDYSHTQLREAVERRYLRDTVRIGRHREVARHFWDCGYASKRALSELPYHLTCGERWDVLTRVLRDLNMVDAKCAAGMTYELVSDYDFACERLPQLRAAREQDEADRERLRGYAAELAGYAARATQQKAGGGRHTPPVAPACRMPLSVEELGELTEAWMLPDDDARRVEQYARFVRSEAHHLARFAALPGFCGQHAHNTRHRWLAVGTDAIKTLNADQEHFAVLAPPPPMGLVNPFAPFPLALVGHSETVVGLGMSAEGGTVASASWDTTVRVWDVSSGRCRHVLRLARRPEALALTPDGRLVAVSDTEGAVAVWDAVTGNLLHSLQAGPPAITSIALTADGRFLLTLRADNQIRLWNVVTGEVVRRLSTPETPLGSVAMSADASTIVAVDGGLRTWMREYVSEALDDRAGRQGADRREATGSEMEGDPEGDAFASEGGLDGLLSRNCGLYVWRGPDAEEPVALDGHTGGIDALALTPDGNFAAAGDTSGTVVVWDVRAGECVARTRASDNVVASVAMSADGRVIACGCMDSWLRCFEAGGGEPLRNVPRYASCLAWSADAAVGVVASHGGDVWVWDVTRGWGASETLRHSIRACSIAFTRDGARAVSGGWDRTIRVWDPDSCECVQTIPHRLNAVTGLAISCDGSLALTSSLSGEVQGWDLNTGECLWVGEADAGGALGMAMASSGAFGVCIGDDRRPWLWRTSDGVSMCATIDDCRSVAVGPDNRALAIGLEDGSVQVLDLQMSRWLATLTEHAGAVCCVAFSPDGCLLASGDDAGGVCVWDVVEARLLLRLGGHIGAVRAVRFINGTNLLASAGDDASIRVCDCASGQCVAAVGLDAPATALDASVARMAVALNDGAVGFYRLRNVEYDRFAVTVLPPAPGEGGSLDAPGVHRAVCPACGSDVVPPEAWARIAIEVGGRTDAVEIPSLAPARRATGADALCVDCGTCGAPLCFNPFVPEYDLPWRETGGDTDRDADIPLDALPAVPVPRARAALPMLALAAASVGAFSLGLSPWIWMPAAIVAVLFGAMYALVLSGRVRVVECPDCGAAAAMVGDRLWCRTCLEREDRDQSWPGPS
ncbi:MAG TPA: hypothetical protein DGT21_15940 [Armatimonadetes bacterium]|nr:hypothetical protein [Armatimonadota bacterium]